MIVRFQSYFVLNTSTANAAEWCIPDLVHLCTTSFITIVKAKNALENTPIFPGIINYHRFSTAVGYGSKLFTVTPSTHSMKPPQPFFNSKANITATEVLFFLPLMASLPDGVFENEHPMEIFLCVKHTVKDIFLKAKVWGYLMEPTQCLVILILFL